MSLLRKKLEENLAKVLKPSHRRTSGKNTMNERIRKAMTPVLNEMSGIPEPGPEEGPEKMGLRRENDYDDYDEYTDAPVEPNNPVYMRGWEDGHEAGKIGAAMYGEGIQEGGGQKTVNILKYGEHSNGNYVFAEINPPATSMRNDEEYSYVIASFAAKAGLGNGPEVLLFPADADGNKLDGHELNPTGMGATSLMSFFAQEGYTVTQNPAQPKAPTVHESGGEPTKYRRNQFDVGGKVSKNNRKGRQRRANGEGETMYDTFDSADPGNPVGASRGKYSVGGKTFSTEYNPFGGDDAGERVGPPTKGHIPPTFEDWLDKRGKKLKETQEHGEDDGQSGERSKKRREQKRAKQDARRRTGDKAEHQRDLDAAEKADSAQRHQRREKRAARDQKWANNAAEDAARDTARRSDASYRKQRRDSKKPMARLKKFGQKAKDLFTEDESEIKGEVDPAIKGTFVYQKNKRGKKLKEGEVVDFAKAKKRITKKDKKRRIDPIESFTDILNRSFSESPLSMVPKSKKSPLFSAMVKRYKKFLSDQNQFAIPEEYMGFWLEEKLEKMGIEVEMNSVESLMMRLFDHDDLWLGPR